MVEGANAEKAGNLLSGIFQEGLRIWETAAGAAGGDVERSYIIGGYSVRLRFAGPALVDAMTRALAHLEADPALEPMLTIHLGDSDSTGVDLPAQLGLVMGGQSGAGWIHHGRRIRARFQPAANTFHILDSSRDSALFWTEDALRIRFWERSAPLLYLFHWWMGLHDRQLIHAAGLGTPTGGVLLVGRAGSGKSTAALSCIQSELAYAGDDYHLIALEPSPFAFSLYNSAKLDQAQLQQFERLRRAVANPHEAAEGKALLFIHECHPEKLSLGFPIRAVLVPRITHRKETNLRPASPATALAALAPSTIFQLRDRDAGSLKAMAELLRRVPSFVLELGTELSQIAPAISELLSRPHAGRDATPRPLVSVVVPVYNGERFLAAALDSIFAQDYHPIEVIVVDDGSEDRSAEIACSFREARYLCQPNSGLAAARNAGIEKARGEFIAFLDADDLMLSNKLSAQVHYLRQHPEVGCVLCRQKILLEPNTPVPAWLKPDPVFGDPGGIVPQSALIRRTAIQSAGGFDPTYRIAVGMEWLGRLRDAGVKTAVTPEVLMLRRIHESNLTHQNRQLREELLRGLKGKIDRKRASRPARRGGY